jgi:hypothetical protein
MPCSLYKSLQVPCDMSCTLPATAQFAVRTTPLQSTKIQVWDFITGLPQLPLVASILGGWVMTSLVIPTGVLCCGVLCYAVCTFYRQSPSDQSFAEAEARKLLTHLLLQRHWWVCRQPGPILLATSRTPLLEKGGGVGWNPLLNCAHAAASAVN